MPTTLLQVPRRTFRRLRESRKSPGVCLGVCGYSRKSPGIYFGVCGYSRKSPGICFGVCGFSRKSPGICFGVCASRASLEVFAEAFAQVAQVPRHLPRRLRKPRKSRGICRDVCASCASSKIFVGACLFVDNDRPIYGSPRARRLMACSMSPPRRSASRMTSTFSVSSVV